MRHSVLTVMFDMFPTDYLYSSCCMLHLNPLRLARSLFAPLGLNWDFRNWCFDILDDLQPFCGSTRSTSLCFWNLPCQPDWRFLLFVWVNSNLMMFTDLFETWQLTANTQMVNLILTASYFEKNMNKIRC